MSTPRPTGLRALLAAAVAVATSALALAAASPGASALAIVRCTGTENSRFSPGLTNTPATSTMTVTDVLSPCVDLADPFDPHVATLTRSTTGTRSCDDLLRAGTNTKVFTWDDATTSTHTYNTTIQLVQGTAIVTETGAITAGRYSGSTAVGVVAQPGDLTACSTPTGLTGRTGPYSLTIVG